MSNNSNISFWATRFCVGVMGVLCVFTIVPLVCYMYMAHTLDIKPIFRKILSDGHIQVVKNDIDRQNIKREFGDITEFVSQKESNASIKDVEGTQKTIAINLQAKGGFYSEKKDYYAKFVNENFSNRRNLLEASNAYDECIAWNLSIGYNATVNLWDLHLGVFDVKCGMEEAIKKISEFRDWLKKQNILLFFAFAPKKADLNSPYTYLYDYSIRNTEELLSGLREHEVPVLDLFEPMKNLGGEFMDLYYKTDHHWKPETGLWATKEIAKWLAKQTDIRIDTNLYLPEKYDYQTTERCFMGGYGKKLTNARCTPDDFTFVIPNFSTKLHAKKFSYDGRVIKDIIGDCGMLHDIIPSYVSFMEDCSIVQIENLQAINNYKILMIGDSFTNVVEPFLALGVKEFHSIDVRQMKGMRASDFILKNGTYDAVIMLYSAHSFPTLNAFVF